MEIWNRIVQNQVFQIKISSITEECSFQENGSLQI